MHRQTVATILAAMAAAAPAVAGFDEDFTGATMRLDLFHTGNAETEIVSVDRARIEGPWPGSRTRLVDDTGLGKYSFAVSDEVEGRLLYSRGFASIYGEWETTGPAIEGTVRTWPEALRFPEPRRPVRVGLSKRGTDGAFHEIWSTRIDPASRFVDRSAVAEQRVWTVLDSGDPATKVDLLLLGDGYTAAQLDKFHSDVQRMTDELFAVEPFASHRDSFNVRAIDSPAAEAGISRPRAGVFRQSPLATTYDFFDSERYLLSRNDRAWRDVAAAAPYDFVVILANERKYGGGGIYQLYATVGVDSAFSPYIMVHEFGHAFAALADEYYTSSVAYEDFQGQLSEPWEPNVTALLDPAHLKWGDLVENGTPVPTPWRKEEYESASRAIQEERARLRDAGAAEDELEALFTREREEMTARLGSEQYAGRVGAFEGASYQPRGLYRPTTDCIMFTRDEVGFCPVCSAAVERVIRMYSE